MVSSELGQEIDKMFFVLSRAWDKDSPCAEFFFVSRSSQDEKHLSLKNLSLINLSTSRGLVATYHN